MRYLAFLVVSALLLVLAGCERTVAPPLVEVTELAPREVEPGDRLEIHGTGFPQGRNGKIVLEGTAYRPGEAPQEHITVEADGVVAAPDRMDVVIRESLTERICGKGDRASHATFYGSVLVSFASNDPTAPPLIGRMKTATLDVEPMSVRATSLDARTAEGTHVLAYLGITPGAPTPRGIPVEKIEPGSSAERVNIQTGDVIIAFDSVHTLALADIAPASSRTADITILHGDSGAEDTKTVSLINYSAERVPSEYAPALVVVGLALAVLVLLVLPGPPALAGLELQIAQQLRRTSWRAALAALFGTRAGLAVSALTTAALAAFALVPFVVGREVDGFALFAIAGTLFVCAAGAKARGFKNVVKRSFEALMIVLVIGAAIALAIGQVGAIELSEIVRLQGSLPWQVEATRHPACAVLALVYFGAVIALLRRRAGAEPTLERAGVLFASALGVAVFFGGWQLGGAAGFCAKVWLATAICLGTRKVAVGLEAAELRRIVVRRLLPGLLLGAGLVAASRRLVPSVTVETAIGATLVALVALFSVRIVVRVRSAIGRPEPHASPFI